VTAPDWKIQYHEDNSVGFTQYTGGGVVNTVASSTMNAMNGESGGYTIPLDSNTRLGIIFPCLMDVVCVFANTNGTDTTGSVLRTSTDTTIGDDGTWSPSPHAAGLATYLITGSAVMCNCDHNGIRRP
jgi:hypothetical protein